MENIKGIEKLTENQQDIMKRVNELHTQIVGNDYKDGMKITEVWLDENNIVCVRLKNKEWYHYTKNNEWY